MTAPVHCPACQRPFVMAVAEARENDPHGRKQVLVYSHQDGTSCVEPRWKRPRVVLIEDEVGLREFTAMVLEEEGYTVAAAANPDQGMAAINEAPTDLVVIDYGTGAPRVLQLLEERPPAWRPPVVIVSGTHPQLPTTGCVKAWLAKPFTPRQIAEVCARALRLGEG